jgi:hypothetical protein
MGKSLMQRKTIRKKNLKKEEFMRYPNTICGFIVNLIFSVSAI